MESEGELFLFESLYSQLENLCIIYGTNMFYKVVEELRKDRPDIIDPIGVLEENR